MEAYQQRVIDEKAELDDKLVSLIAFIGSPIYNKMDERGKDLLVQQSHIMLSYSHTLAARIGTFKE
jgi:hypothetical protein